MTARVTRQPVDEPIQLPTHIIARRTKGDMRGPRQEDMSEEELFRTTERMIYGRTPQQVTEEILDKVHYQPRQAVSTIIPPVNPLVQEASNLDPPSTPSGSHKNRREKRKEAKKKWFLKKKMKTAF